MAKGSTGQAGGGPLRLICLEGDGVGPEITAAAISVLRSASLVWDLNIRIESAEIGLASLKSQGTTYPDSVHEQAKAADGVVLGPVSHNDYPPIAEGGLNPSGELRKRLDLFANIRPARTRHGLPSASRVPFDLVVVRENTEGFYADRSMFLGPGEYMPTPDLALSTRKVSRSACKRIVEEAFRIARLRRGKVTAVHKANVLRISDGLFLEEARKIAAKNPSIDYQEQLVDAMAALLIRDASLFDVIVTTNMFGDILSDEASELAGGLGLGASLNIGNAHAVSQAQHGSAPTLAGKDVANPSALIASVAMLLSWLGTRHKRVDLKRAARAIQEALDRTIDDPSDRTRDMGGMLGTNAFTQRVIFHLEGKLQGTKKKNT